MTKKTALTAAVAGWAIMASPAEAAKSPATVQITTNPQECTAQVTVSYPAGNDKGLAGIQVNIDSVGSQDLDRKLNGAGDAFVNVPGGPYVFSFQLADNDAHIIDALTLGPVTERTTNVVQLDCREPVPPVVERVEVPVEVQVPVNVPGPERIVTRRVTVTRKAKVRCERRWSKRTRKLVIVKGSCHKPPKRHVKVKAPGTVQLPKFTG